MQLLSILNNIKYIVNTVVLVDNTVGIHSTVSPVLCAADDEETGSLMRVQFEAYAQSLPTCVNRDLIDKVCTPAAWNLLSHLCVNGGWQRT